MDTHFTTAQLMAAIRKGDFFKADVYNCLYNFNNADSFAQQNMNVLGSRSRSKSRSRSRSSTAQQRMLVMSMNGPAWPTGR